MEKDGGSEGLRLTDQTFSRLSSVATGRSIGIAALYGQRPPRERHSHSCRRYGTCTRI